MSFIRELKRRNVFRVAIAYGAVGWLLVEVASVLFPTFEAPAWVMKVFATLIILGFPLALFLAWAFELTPDGLKKEKDVDRSLPIASQTGRKIDYVIISVLVVALSFFAYDKFVLSPGREVALVAAGIQSAKEKAADPAEVTVAAGKSIAVLPFENISQDPANAPFVIGIHDDLLTHLSKISSIKTISRTSVLQYRGTTKTIPQIARELGVATVLEGGVQRVGDRVRINVQLIDAKTDENLWAETYDRQLTATNIFMIQSEIATAIADALRATLLPIEQKRLATIPTENLAALEAYFLGKQSMAKRTGAALVEAIDYFRKAIELDPGFALAYVGQADSLTLQIEYSGLSQEEAFASAEPLIDKALELDDQSGEAFTSLAFFLLKKKGHTAAETAFRHALELSPNYVSAHHWYSLFLRQYGHYDAGLKEINDAIQLDPLSPVLQANLGTVLFELGRPEESIAQYKKTIDTDAAFPISYWSVAAIYWTHFGQLDEALLWFRQSLERDPGDANVNAWIGLLYLDLGDRAEAEHWIDKALELGPDSVIPNWAKEMLLLFQGEKTQAREYAGKVLRQDPGWTLSLANLGNQDLLAGLAADASARYEKHFPMLFDDGDPKIDRSNVDAAINLGLILTNLGQSSRAKLLLDRSLDYTESTSMPRIHWYPIAYGIPQQVQIYALQGKTKKALAALRQAIDNGWRALWWYWLEHDPNLDSIRDEPEFQAMVAEIRLDMAAQLERVRHK
ncbi:MAG: tetratricopeptide repeat protein [Proteobacteria bacterium]|nr:tetratricopeptide repeat protein [Pseudomonadota bacterium]